MVWSIFKSLFSPPPERTALAGLKAGRVQITGVARPGERTLASPIGGLACVAFFYRSTWAAPTRGSKVDRLVEQAQVYAPGFLLELDDATVQVEPPESGRFAREDHQRLLAAGLPGFKAEEQLMRPGDRLRLSGRLHLDGERPRLELSRAEILEVAADAGKKPKRWPKRRRAL